MRGQGAIGKAPPKVGELGPLVKTGYGYHVIEVLKRQDGTLVPFEEVAKSIKAQLEREEKDKVFAVYRKKLCDKADIVYADGYAPTGG